MSVLVISDMIGLIVYTLTDDGKYSVRNRKNLPQPIQIQLSETYLKRKEKKSWPTYDMFFPN